MTTTTRSTVFTSHWPDAETPEVPLPEFLLASAAARAGEPALVDGPTGRATSYGELAAGVRPVAAALAARGLRKGEVFAVLVLAPNIPEWLLAATAR
jgi:acyl-CoA synthetase (AMP-forming)/AMP-acid ligase II